ncbi:MAG: hypothetical protein ACJA0T_000971 [Colwellia sp.]|jgi:hypothetical protein
MTKKLVITLDEKATENYLKLAGQKVEAEVNEDCMPTGCAITINIEPSYLESTAYFGTTEIGEVTVGLVTSPLKSH